MYSPPSEVEYNRRIQRCLDETCFLSWGYEKHPSGRAVLELGPKIIRWLAQDLRDREEGFWVFCDLLQELLQDGPEIPEEELGRSEQMRPRWITFLIDRGFIAEITEK